MPLPDALLFVTPDCPHCATVMRGLDELARGELVGKVTVVDAAEHPGLAAEHGVRAAPWLRLGPFTLTGAHSVAELKRWAERAGSEAGAAHYVAHLLEQGDYKQAKAFVAKDARRLSPLLAIIADTDAGIDMRLGVSALLESYAGTGELRQVLPQLGELAHHADHRVRADACHLLGLTGSAAGRDFIAPCLNDASVEVREIAAEALERLA